MKTPKFSRLRRLVTERDAQRVKRHGRLVNIGTTGSYEFRTYRYKGATFVESAHK